MYCVLLAAYSLMAADRYLFPALAANVRQEFAFSIPRTGLLTTIFTLGLGIGGLPTGYLLSRFTRKLVMLTGIAIFSAGIAATTIATGFWTMLICLAVTGIGMAMMATPMFALAASYFYRNRAAAIGSVNVCYGLGGFYAPVLTPIVLASYGTWRAPMLAFAAVGFVMIVLIALLVRPWFSETRRAAVAKAGSGGADTLMNRNTILLTALSVVEGLALYSFLGMYTTYLRVELQYDPATAIPIMKYFGLGALLSIFGGWLGDRLSPRVVMGGGFLLSALLGYLLYQPDASVAMRNFLTFSYGVVASAVLYVNLAGYHVKALRGHLASRGSGMFVTTLYASSALAGYLMGELVSNFGWLLAGELQMSLLCMIGAALSLALRPSEMSL